jgi:hypothetical protein
MGDIRSAREIAMEKVAQLDDATPEERLSWKYRPEGEHLAARYLKDDESLLAGVGRFDENVQRFVRGGAADVLIRTITLPRTDYVKNVNRKAMEGLRLLKNDKAQLENVFSRIRQLFAHYADQVEKQLGSLSGANIDVEKLPQFQQEWRKVLGQLDSQYLVLLKDYKDGMIALK